MQQFTPLSSDAATDYSKLKTSIKRRFSAKIAVIGVTVSAMALSVGLSASASAQGPQSCDLVSGSVLSNNRLGLTVKVTNAITDRYNVVLYNQGPVGVQTPALVVGETLEGNYDKVDIGYAGRRAVESGVSAAFVVGIAPASVAPTPDNSTFCTGSVALIDNPTEGTFFRVSH
jgi:hypothetical protein